MTTTVKYNAIRQHGEAAAGARLKVLLTRVDKDGTTFVQPEPMEFTADENGMIEMDLWPNESGTEATQYQVFLYRKSDGREIWKATITVPDVAEVDMASIVSMPPFPPVDESQQALQAVQDAAAQALLDIGDAETDAVTAITDARDAGVTAIEDARDQGVGAIEQARDDAINAINGLVQQAEDARDASQDARDLSQAWATGTEPGGEGTKSSREHAEDSAQSASDAEGFKDDAETAANRIPDPTGQPAGQVPQTDGADGYDLVERFSADDLQDESNHLRSPAAQIALPGYGSNASGSLRENQPLRMWGHPSAPYTGQTPLAGFGPFDVVFPLTWRSSVNVPTAHVAFSYKGAPVNDAVTVGWILDEDNYIRIAPGRASIAVIECISGVESQISSTSYTGITITDMEHLLHWWFGRNGVDNSRLFSESSGSLNIDHTTNGLALLDCGFIGFGQQGNRSEIYSAWVWGDRLESVG